MLFLNRMSWTIGMSMIMTVAWVMDAHSQDQDVTAASSYNEGLALLKAKQYSEGLELMEEALELASADEDEKIISLAKTNGSIAAYNLANEKRKAKSMDEALTYYNKAIELNPDYSSSYEGLGRVMESKGDKQQAIAHYLKSAQLAVTEGKIDRADSRYAKIRTMIGKMYVSKDYDGAIAGGKTFVAVNDSDADVHYYLSQALAEKGELDDAIAHISKAIALSGTETPDKFYYAQGTQLEQGGKHAEAIAAYSKITDAKFKAQADYRIAELSK